MNNASWLPRYLTWIHSSRVPHDNVRVSASVKRPLIIYCYHIATALLVVIVIEVWEIVVARSVVAGRGIVRVLLEIVSECIEKV